MTYEIHTFTVADPRTFDGDPFEVAERSVRQAAAVAAVLRTALEGARLMARNAEMERQLLNTGECSAQEFEDGPQARKLDDLTGKVGEIDAALVLLAAAVAWNPKKPPRA